jgi:hypothetical protein
MIEKFNERFAELQLRASSAKEKMHRDALGVEFTMLMEEFRDWAFNEGYNAGWNDGVDDCASRD